MSHRFRDAQRERTHTHSHLASLLGTDGCCPVLADFSEQARGPILRSFKRGLPFESPGRRIFRKVIDDALHSRIHFHWEMFPVLADAATGVASVAGEHAGVISHSHNDGEVSGRRRLRGGRQPDGLHSICIGGLLFNSSSCISSELSIIRGSSFGTARNILQLPIPKPGSSRVMRSSLRSFHAAFT